jgi:hypothetical protein
MNPSIENSATFGWPDGETVRLLNRWVFSSNPKQ